MIAMQRLRTRSFLLLATVMLHACSDATEPLIPSSIDAVAANVVTGTAGVNLGTAPRVVVRDQFGNAMPDVEVTFKPGPGSGFVMGGTQLTDANGVAQPDSWRLGNTAGEQSLIARTATDTVRITVIAEPGPANNVVFVRGNPRSAPVGSTLETGVRVTDAHNNGIAGVTVHFEVAAGGGSLSGPATGTTDDSGFAGVGTWTLGTALQAQVLTATVSPTIAAQLTVDTRAGAPAVLEMNGGDDQAGQPNGPTASPPVVTVRDSYGNPVRGVSVTFEVTSGGGAVKDPVVVTDSAGVASPGIWLLGPVPGENVLRASVAAVEPVVFTAVSAGEPLESIVMVKLAGDLTTCPAGTDHCRFAVLVKTLLEEPVEGQTVTWTAGGVTRTTTTNASGHAVAPNLVVGSTGAGTQTARLETTGDELVFSYRHVTGGEFDIDMRFLGNATPSQQAIFTAAVERWEEVITGDQPSFTFTSQHGAGAGECGVGHPPILGTVDDLLIYVEVVEIDGVGSVLGQAGPCYIHPTGGLPMVGIVKLDEDDVASMEANGTLYDVVLHELGHVLGIGGHMWRVRSLVTGRNGEDPYFTGERATSGFLLGGGLLVNGVPVENSGGEGTRDSHWRETTFFNELMTGFINQGGNPLSIMTIGSLMDLGYEVDFGAADVYVVPPPFNMLLSARAFPGGTELRELPMPAPRTPGGRH